MVIIALGVSQMRIEVLQLLLSVIVQKSVEKLLVIRPTEETLSEFAKEINYGEMCLH